MLDQFGTGDDAAVVVHQVGEQAVFMGGQLDLLAAAGDASGLGVEADGAAFDFGFGVARGAADLGADAGEQFFHMEGLGQIIVGTGVHTGDLIAPAIAGGQDDDGHLLFGTAPLFQDRDAVHLREADVEHDHVVGLSVAKVIAFFAVECCVDGIAGVAQRGDELAVQVFIILDDKDAHRGTFCWLYLDVTDVMAVLHHKATLDAGQAQRSKGCLASTSMDFIWPPVVRTTSL